MDENNKLDIENQVNIFEDIFNEINKERKIYQEKLLKNL